MTAALTLRFSSKGRVRAALLFLYICAGGCGTTAPPPSAPLPVEPVLRQRAEPACLRDVSIPVRDGVRLQADVLLPSAAGRFPVLIHRTPYGREPDARGDTIVARALERGYAVVLQDVRGRHGSEGEFDPYRQEGLDGFDTIEWAAVQPWSDGRVGTYGLSYPGAVQWLAAVEAPPHLRAMVPAMTFSSPRNFFTSGGVFDLSWIGWIATNIAPDARARKDLAGPRTAAEADEAWERDGDRMRSHLPLAELPDLKDVAPWYDAWLSHPPASRWWDALELRGRQRLTRAAVLHLSGWHDETYGPEGALTNHTALWNARTGTRDRRTQLVIGPWTHGAGAIGRTNSGEREHGPAAALDHDELVLDFLDRYVRDVENGVDARNPVRWFVMGAGVWREGETWPPPARATSFHLGAGGLLTPEPSITPAACTAFTSDPLHPVTDPHAASGGAQDHRELAHRPDVLTFDSAPLEHDLEVTGPITAEIFLSCDAPDTDLWARLLDVAPDGTAWNLMSPGPDVLRASHRNGASEPDLLEPGTVYHLRLENLVTSNRFLRGHKLRVQLSATFFPHFSRNLHTGRSEVLSSASRTATIRIHHDRRHRSRVVLPVVDG